MQAHQRCCVGGRGSADFFDFFRSPGQVAACVCQVSVQDILERGVESGFIPADGVGDGDLDLLLAPGAFPASEACWGFA
jgi:hypothetical protein